MCPSPPLHGVVWLVAERPRGAEAGGVFLTSRHRRHPGRCWRHLLVTSRGFRTRPLTGYPGAEVGVPAGEGPTAQTDSREPSRHSQSPGLAAADSASACSSLPRGSRLPEFPNPGACCGSLSVGPSAAGPVGMRRPPRGVGVGVQGRRGGSTEATRAPGTPSPGVRETCFPLQPLFHGWSCSLSGVGLATCATQTVVRAKRHQHLLAFKSRNKTRR